MAIKLHHAIVHARDKRESVAVFALEIIARPYGSG
jgi:hypothetical protein